MSARRRWSLSVGVFILSNWFSALIPSCLFVVLSCLFVFVVWQGLAVKMGPNGPNAAILEYVSFRVWVRVPSATCSLHTFATVLGCVAVSGIVRSLWVEWSVASGFSVFQAWRCQPHVLLLAESGILWGGGILLEDQPARLWKATMIWTLEERRI